MIIAVDSSVFRMYEKTPTGFVPHLFESHAAFKYWMGTQSHGFMVPRSQVRGRVWEVVDHRGEIFNDDFLDDVYCPHCGSQEKRETDLFSFLCCTCRRSYQTR